MTANMEEQNDIHSDEDKKIIRRTIWNIMLVSFAYANIQQLTIILIHKNISCTLIWWCEIFESVAHAPYIAVPLTTTIVSSISSIYWFRRYENKKRMIEFDK